MNFENYIWLQIYTKETSPGKLCYCFRNFFSTGTVHTRKKYFFFIFRIFISPLLMVGGRVSTRFNMWQPLRSPHWDSCKLLIGKSEEVWKKVLHCCHCSTATTSSRERGKQHASKSTRKNGWGLCSLTATGQGSSSLGIHRGLGLILFQSIVQVLATLGTFWG